MQDLRIFVAGTRSATFWHKVACTLCTHQFSCARTGTLRICLCNSVVLTTSLLRGLCQAKVCPLMCCTPVCGAAYWYSVGLLSKVELPPGSSVRSDLGAAPYSSSGGSSQLTSLCLIGCIMVSQPCLTQQAGVCSCCLHRLDLG